MPLHPRLVHLPLALAVLMPLVALAIGVAWWRGQLPRRAWALVVGLQSVLVLSGFAALSSGQLDAERVAAIVARAAIEQHDDAASTFVCGALGLLGLMATALIAKNDAQARRLSAASVMGAVFVLWLGYRTGEAGGRLVYEHGAARAFTGASNTRK
jgi:uncharacterized membrane protein